MYIEWEIIGRNLNEFGKKFAEIGILFGYHNHAHEFVKFDGEYALDIIYKNCKPEYVSAEIDTYWVKKGGEDPAEYTKKYEDRLYLLHAKDLNDNGEDTEVGRGSIDFKTVIGGLKNLKWVIIEQEQYNYPILESIKIGCDNMKKLIADM